MRHAGRRVDAASWGTTTLVLGVVWLGAAATSCRDKDLECPSLENDACADHGVPEVENAATCDACGELWYCHYYAPMSGEIAPMWQLGYTTYSCECIDDDGILRLDTGSGLCGTGGITSPD